MGRPPRRTRPRASTSPEDDGVILIDACAPRYRSQLERGLAQIGRGLDDVRAVDIIHGDADHKGFAEKVRREQGVPVYVHSADKELTGTGNQLMSSVPMRRTPGTIAGNRCGTS